VSTSQLLTEGLDSYRKHICKVAFSLLQVQNTVESNTITVTDLGDLPKLQLQRTSGEDRRGKGFICAKLENGEYLGAYAEA